MTTTTTPDVILPVQVLHSIYLAAAKLTDIAPMTGVYVLAWIYCAEHHTDGYVPASWLVEDARVGSPLKVAAAFVKAKLWEDTEAGWRIRGFTLIYAPVTDQGLKDSRRDRDRARKAHQRGRILPFGTSGTNDPISEKPSICPTADHPALGEPVPPLITPLIDKVSHGTQIDPYISTSTSTQVQERERAAPPLLPADVFAAWNQGRGTLAKCVAVTKDRKARARDLCREINLYAADVGQAPRTVVDTVIAAIATDAYCNGDNPHDWRADLDHLLKPGTWARIVEGRWSRRKVAVVTARATVAQTTDYVAKLKARVQR